MDQIVSNKAPAAAGQAQRVVRHAGLDRLYHWLMAVCVLTLMATAFLPILGIKFEWLDIHWITGVVLAALILIHIVRALFFQDWRNMWIGRRDLQEAWRSVARLLGGRAALPKPGKYDASQKLYHLAVAIVVLSAVGSGLLMLLKIDTPLMAPQSLCVLGRHLGRDLRGPWHGGHDDRRHRDHPSLFHPHAGRLVHASRHGSRLDQPRGIRTASRCRALEGITANRRALAPPAAPGASMASPETDKPQTVAAAIDTIESTYELMLAYAAQGRASEENDPLGLRAALQRADAALDVLAAATPADLASPGGAIAQATADMLAVLRQDVARARAAIRFVLAQRALGSQIIDNLNASIHIRALLTDIFLLDEAFEKAPSA